VIAGIEGDFEMQYVSSLAWEGFRQTSEDKFFVVSGMECVWSTQVELHYASSLAWSTHDVFCVL